jgi:hypothetical protein
MNAALLLKSMTSPFGWICLLAWKELDLPMILSLVMEITFIDSWILGLPSIIFDYSLEMLPLLEGEEEICFCPGRPMQLNENYCLSD